MLAARDRNKTLTCLARAEPVAGAQHPVVRRLQWFLSESRWDPDRINERGLQLLHPKPATAPHSGGVLIIDDSGDRKDGTATVHVGPIWHGTGLTAARAPLTRPPRHPQRLRHRLTLDC